MSVKKSPVKAASLRPQNWQQMQAFVEKLLAGHLPMDKVNLGSVQQFSGTGSPEGKVVANIGSSYHRVDGSTGTSFYVKESYSGDGSTGWVAK